MIKQIQKNITNNVNLYKSDKLGENCIYYKEKSEKLSSSGLTLLRRKNVEL